MRTLVIAVALSALCLTGGARVVTAQEGHPLKGSWIGTWAQNTVHGADVLVILDWNGKAITGTINPGTDNMAIKNATLNPEGWLVHLEADAKDKSGAVVTYVIDGKIENLAMHNRTVTGTWKSQRGTGPFKITRQ
jgi:hypothetical protein